MKVSANNSKVDKFKHSIAEFISANFSNYPILINEHEGKFSVTNDIYVVNITLRKDLFAYDFHVKKDILGFAVGITDKIDMQPIDNEMPDMYNAMNDMLRNIVEDTIYIAGRKKKASIAWRKKDGSFTMKHYKKNLFGVSIRQVDSVSLSDLNDMKRLSSLTEFQSN